MADIELVIKIPEEIYKSYKSEQNNDCVIGGLFFSNPAMYNLITNATPLPKGHGDLIDRNELFKYKNGGEYNGIGFSREYVYVGDICNAQTIIKADDEQMETYKSTKNTDNKGFER